MMEDIIIELGSIYDYAQTQEEVLEAFTHAIDKVAYRFNLWMNVILTVEWIAFGLGVATLLVLITRGLRERRHGGCPSSREERT
jgi:hypothetical protein